MIFHCRPSNHGVLGLISLRIRPNDAITLINPANTNGAAVVGLLSHFCSITRNSIAVSNRSIHSIALRSLHQRVNIVLRSAFVFSNGIHRGVHCNGLSTASTRVRTTTGTIRTRRFVVSLPGKCSAIIRRHNSALSTNRHRLVTFTHILLTSPHVLVLSRTASGVSAHARRTLRTKLGRLLGKHADFVVTRQLSAVRGTSVVYCVSRKRVVRRNGRTRLLTGHNTCCHLCSSRCTVVGIWVN